MAIKYKNKINRIRTFALSLIFIGFGIMYAGLLVRKIEWLMVVFMLLGGISLILSTLVYASIGMLSTRTIPVTCPSCGKQTKMLGRVDACMHCKQPLTMDKTLEGKDFDEKYNSKRYQSENNDNE